MNWIAPLEKRHGIAVDPVRANSGLTFQGYSGPVPGRCPGYRLITHILPH